MMLIICQCYSKQTVIFKLLAYLFLIYLCCGRGLNIDVALKMNFGETCIFFMRHTGLVALEWRLWAKMMRKGPPPWALKAVTRLSYCS